MPAQYKNGTNFNHAHGQFCIVSTTFAEVFLDVCDSSYLSMIAKENRRKSYLGVMKVCRKFQDPFGTWGPVQCGEGAVCVLSGFWFSLLKF